MILGLPSEHGKPFEPKKPTNAQILPLVTPLELMNLSLGTTLKALNLFKN